ncbi:prepilin-type N-terminal cleavage/methylation domain-containing protein [Neobacillus rhizosphaerae]|uniref:type II secretion system protein n=1 Tax=Neobacillus rhizosphaerae TaxID=2880965 RepID=UPI003D29C540
MIIIKSEKGYTLILVMIVMTVVMILGLALSGAALNARTQVKKTDFHNKATDLAEMGITYYQPIVTNLVTTAKATATAKKAIATNTKSYDYYFHEALLTSLRNSIAPVEVDTTNNKFEITFKTIDPPNSDAVSNKIIINFESKGTASGEPATVNGFFTIDKISQSNKVGQPKPAPSSYTTNETQQVLLLNSSKDKNKDKPYEYSTYFSNDIVIEGKRSVTVKGDAYITKLTLQGSARINIYGDAIFANTIVNIGEAYGVCITGKTYKLDSNFKLVDYPIAKNTCYTPAVSEWLFNADKGTKVKY